MGVGDQNKTVKRNGKDKGFVPRMIPRPEAGRRNQQSEGKGPTYLPTGNRRDVSSAWKQGAGMC